MAGKILVGLCYGFITVLLMRGSLAMPQLLSQILGITAAALCVRKVIADAPQIWAAVGFTAGAALAIAASGVMPEWGW